MIYTSSLAMATILVLSVVPMAFGATGTFTDLKVAGGLNMPTAMEFAPDGRLFVAEKSGALRVIKDGQLLSAPFLTVPAQTFGERGLLGLAFDPNFVENGYVYVHYTFSGGGVIHGKVSRFTADPANPDRALAGSELAILNLETTGNGFHNGGAIHFGPDGKLYVAVGDHGSSSNSQSLATRQGKMLRINSDGTIPADNPFYNTPGARKEIWALGLRNPFTFGFSPTGVMHINDVGQDSWEEVNIGKAGANYGWPMCEGYCASHAGPLHAYPHPADGGMSIAGAAFYDASQFPSEYRGSYFFGDYVGGFIKRLTPDGTAVDFLSDLVTPVDVKVGPDGSLYYLSIWTGEVHKVQYVAGPNGPPSASAISVPGASPANFSFDGSASSDPDGDLLNYRWDFGDGSSAGGTKTAHTYAFPGQYAVTLTVDDGIGGTSATTIMVTVGSPPTGAIGGPATGTKYNAGDTISFSGSAADAQDGNSLPASAFKWTILFHHNTHTHPLEEFEGVKSGSFKVPTTGETEHDVWYRIYLTVTDSSGLSHTTTRDVTPNKASITLASNVAGLQVNLDGQPKTIPHTFTGVAGIERTLQAPLEQTVGGKTYRFQSWSDGGVATHVISTPASGATYTANYSPATTTLKVETQDDAGNAVEGHWTVLYNAAGAFADGRFSPATFTLDGDGKYYIRATSYGGHVFERWLDGSTENPRAVSAADATAATLTAVYRFEPIVHMSDTSTSWGSLLYAGRQVNAEYVTGSSQLVGDRVDSITVQLGKVGLPEGVAEVGVIGEDLTVKKLFGTVDASSLTAEYRDYEFKIDELYTIQAGDRIGIKYSAGDAQNAIAVMIDRNLDSEFDGTASQRIRHESSGWLYYDTGEDLYMILRQTRG
jgi:glucose/arabinose dehydrogenase